MTRRTALVTGASGGIGAEFARRLAVDHDVLLVARSGDRLEELAAELGQRHPDGVFGSCVADLSRPAGVRAVLDRVREDRLEVDLLVNNAGVGSHGVFAEQDADAALDQIQLNCVALVGLTRALLPPMLQRRRGAVVNVASTAAFQPIPTMAVYAATKAFVLSFSEALRVETRRGGVHVLALCPGPTETGFFDAAGKTFLTAGRQTSAEVVTAALNGLRRRRPVVVSGRANQVKALGYRFLPRSLVARGSAAVVRES